METQAQLEKEESPRKYGMKWDPVAWKSKASPAPHLSAPPPAPPRASVFHLQNEEGRSRHGWSPEIHSGPRRCLLHRPARQVSVSINIASSGTLLTGTVLHPDISQGGDGIPERGQDLTTQGVSGRPGTHIGSLCPFVPRCHLLPPGEKCRPLPSRATLMMVSVTMVAPVFLRYLSSARPWLPPKHTYRSPQKGDRFPSSCRCQAGR